MAFTNETTGITHLKILYAGATNAGKSKNIQSIYQIIKAPFLSDQEKKASLCFLKNDLFEFLPLKYSFQNKQEVIIHLFTFPAHDSWETVNINLMQGIDGLIYVVDSRKSFFKSSERQIQRIERFLKIPFLRIDSIATVYQLNYYDNPEALPVQTLKSSLNILDSNCICANAASGLGVIETLEALINKIPFP
ncbi:MAG: hypothetical protein K2X39_02345 [Silvanigrellaceae bacterium]|nr:hypothetical protein [Silvanigrellaceae bacterium]